MYISIFTYYSKRFYFNKQRFFTKWNNYLTSFFFLKTNKLKEMTEIDTPTTMNTNALFAWTLNNGFTILGVGKPLTEIPASTHK